MKKIWSLLLALVILLAIPAMPFAEELPVSGAEESAPADSPEIPPTPPKPEEIIEEVQTIYRLTIYYIYLDGSTAAETYTEKLSAGTSYSVVSPVILGYVATMDVVTGVMPARDVEYTVIYIPGGGGGGGEGTDDPDDPEGKKKKSSFLTIEDFETALGLGTTYMNIGICIE